MKIVTIIGARPQFIKAGVVSRVIRKTHSEILVHTGQHYDANMSEIFFQELDIPAPDIHLNIGSGTHAKQTGLMMQQIENILLDQKPEWVIVYGDTNSTISGALAAAKLQVPIVHIEAGLRSFNRAMPEEINRIVTDHISSLLLCPSQTAVAHLQREGITSGVKLVGDVMYEALIYASERSNESSTILQKLGLIPNEYFLATVHRAENTDNPIHLQNIFQAFRRLEQPIVFPIHPRTKIKINNLPEYNARFEKNIKIVEPLGYLDMIMLQQNAKAIITDSGGIQKEAYWLGVPCITMRNETEWVETVELGANVLVGANTQRIVDAAYTNTSKGWYRQIYGDAAAASRCVAAIEEQVQNK